MPLELGEVSSTMSERGRDPYAELGVSPNADAGGIRKAYLAKARLHHPDLGGDDRLMARVNAAYDALRDPAERVASRAAAKHAATGRHRGEPWTGAAGPPPGRPSGSVLDFGLFAGWSLGEIARHDPGYLVWLTDRPDGRPYLAEIESLIAPLRAAAAPDHSKRSRRR